MFNKSLAFIGLSLSLSANAAIVDLGNITHDTDTDLLWLDLTETRGLSYSQVNSMRGEGQAYEGWRYATPQELDQLIINFGYVAINQDCDHGVVHCDNASEWRPESHIIKVMIVTLGDTLDAYYDEINYSRDASPQGAGHARGILGTQNRSAGYYDVAKISDTQLVYRSSGAGAQNSIDRVETLSLSFTDFNDASQDTGSFLVKSTVPPVPVPSAAWLFGSALIGLAGFKRKK